MLKPRILVIDDEQSIGSFFSELLSDPAFEVEVSHSLDVATTKFNAHKPDLVVADIAKIAARDKLRDLIKDMPAIWASRFDTIDIEDLPRMARILNKPFKHVDLKLAIRSEFAKIKKRFDSL